MKIASQYVEVLAKLLRRLLAALKIGSKCGGTKCQTACKLRFFANFCLARNHLRSFASTSVLTMILLCSAAASLASDLLMVRSQQSFPEAMLTLQTSIKEHGYEITRVQRIDIGLTGMGYKTDKYRIVFVGKPKEIQYLVDKYPVLAAYMPPQISIFAEQDETVLVTANPMIYADMVDDKKDKVLFKRWESDIYSVFDDIRDAED